MLILLLYCANYGSIRIGAEGNVMTKTNTDKIEELKNKIKALQEIKEELLSSESDADLIAKLEGTITLLKSRLVKRVTGRNG